MKRQSDATDRLYCAVCNYLEKHGGKAIVIGGIEIIRYPLEPKFKFRLAIRVTGNPPMKPKAV